MEKVKFRTSGKDKDFLKGLLEEKLTVIKIGPVHPGDEYDAYKSMGLPDPKNLKLPIVADAYHLPAECAHFDAYYALCRDEELKRPEHARRVEELRRIRDLPFRVYEQLAARYVRSSGDYDDALEVILE